MYKAHIARLQEKLAEYQTKQAEYEASLAATNEVSVILSASSQQYPIPYALGNPVHEGYWYAIPEQRMKCKCVKSGIPYGMTDPAFFADWEAL